MRTYHLQLDITGTLKNWNPGEWVNVVTGHDGRKMTPHEFRNALIDKLAAGERFIPIGGPCEGWSPQTGCPGHYEQEAARADP